MDYFLYIKSGADLGFCRGGSGFSKNFRKFWRPFFLDRSDWFSELSQSSKKTLFWRNFLRRRQFFEKKQVKKAVFGHFLENFDKKNAFFWRALPLKTRRYWRQRFLKSTKEFLQNSNEDVHPGAANMPKNSIFHQLLTSTHPPPHPNVSTPNVYTPPPPPRQRIHPPTPQRTPIPSRTPQPRRTPLAYPPSTTYPPSLSLVRGHLTVVRVTFCNFS